MSTRQITLPELGLIAGTRAALGAGIALLLADHLDAKQRRAVGWTLFGIGLTTTFPLAAQILRQKPSSNGHPAPHPRASINNPT